MIKREDLLAFDFYKKRPFKGSDNGIRYMITKHVYEIPAEEEGAEPTKNTVLKAYIWPEPFCFEATEDEKKTDKDFEFSEDGLVEAMNWINESH